MENEKEIVKMAQKNPQAFGQIYDAYYQKIFRYVYYRVGSKDIAEDLTAETFFQALKNIWRYRFTRHPFSSWLYRIATIQVAQYYRQKKKYCSLALEECPDLMNFPHYGIDEVVQKIELKNDSSRLHSNMKLLKKEEQDTLSLRYFEDKSIKEISDILGMKINTVKSHIRRGLINLQKLYKEEHYSLSYGLPRGQTTQGNRKGFGEREIA